MGIYRMRNQHSELGAPSCNELGPHNLSIETPHSRKPHGNLSVMPWDHIPTISVLNQRLLSRTLAPQAVGINMDEPIFDYYDNRACWIPTTGC